MQSHIEFQFDDTMTWENQGTVWDLDHVLAVANFKKLKTDPNDLVEVNICYNWTNFEPLECRENRYVKSDNLLLHYYMNSIINVHRYIQYTQSNFEGYQRINESLFWLREKTQVR